MGSVAPTRRFDPAEALRSAFDPAAMIAALSAVGVDREMLVTATGAEERTIRRWAQGSSEPRSTAWDTLDRIRIVALYMLQRGAMPARFIGKWLKARNLELGMDPTTGVRRPLDAIRDDDLPAVFAAINALIRAPGDAGASADDDFGLDIDDDDLEFDEFEAPAPDEVASADFDATTGSVDDAIRNGREAVVEPQSKSHERV